MKAKRGTIFIILFILIALGIIGLSRFLGAQPPLEVNVVVDPLASRWVDSVVTALNASAPVINGRPVLFRVTPLDDLEVWQGSTRWTPEQHPDAWIPASSLSLAYATQNGQPLTTLVPSLASTPLVWGGYQSRVNIITRDGAAFDWSSVAAAARQESWATIGGQSEWQFIKIGLAQPNRKMGGLAALLSAAGALNQSTTLSGGVVNQQAFREQMQPVLSAVNFTTLGADPVSAMVSRGASVVELAIFPEVQWLNGLPGTPGTDPIVLGYPDYQFVLDFPLAGWQGTTVVPEKAQAVQLLAEWLQRPDYQVKAREMGLRSQSGEVTATDALFRTGAQYGIEFQLPAFNTVAAPAISDVQGLIQWSGTVR